MVWMSNNTFHSFFGCLTSHYTFLGLDPVPHPLPLLHRLHQHICAQVRQQSVLLPLLDNAKGQVFLRLSHNCSLGLIIALRTDTHPNTASPVAHYDLPRGRYAQRRVNMQVLNNGNVFTVWSERALQSEHSLDGTLLMESVFVVDWFGSYRWCHLIFKERGRVRTGVARQIFLWGSKWAPADPLLTFTGSYIKRDTVVGIS